MDLSPATRRLAAIVIADVVGYTRLMERDDAGTLSRLREIRDRLIDPVIATYGGRVVRTVGDGMLLDFGSADAALRCAIDVQRAMARRNAPVPADERIDFRIGINIGDIFVEKDDIAGDGVNVAARLEGLAEPGGICVSAAVREQVHGSLDVRFVDIGEQQVKNIARPIRVYRVALQSGVRGLGRVREFLQRVRGRLRGRRLAAAGFALLLAGSALALWVWRISPASSPPPLSIAVLPFDSPVGGAFEKRLAGTITADLTARLGRARRAKVVSQSIAAAYDGRPFDARTIGKDLNVRYLVEGDVHLDGAKIIVKAQLIDAGTGGQVWSERLALERARGAESPDELVARLTFHVRDALYESETRRAASVPLFLAGPADLVLRAESVWSGDPNTTNGAREARKMFDEALRLDPNFSPALLGRARTLWYELELDPGADRVSLAREMDELTRRAISVDGADSVAWGYRAQALIIQNRWDAALEANARAYQLDPTRAIVLSQRAELMINTGKPVEALALIDQAVALEPQAPQDLGWTMLQRCRAYMALGRYDDAITACEQSAAQDDWWVDHFYLTAAYAERGDTAKATREMATLLKQRPGFSIAQLKALQISNDSQYLSQSELRLIAGLRKAGVPEE